MQNMDVALVTVNGGTELNLKVFGPDCPAELMPPMVLFLASIMMRAETDLTWFNDQMDWARKEWLSLKTPPKPDLRVVN